MRAVAWLVLGCLASAPAFAGTWSSLWHTPDQQGEALLAAGHPARAAARFTNPRLKAYADLRAGHYRQAAKLLAPFKDPISEYNRGNALAHTGHLHAALAAYDAALKQAPHDRDIRHNRDLVARMLARQPPRSPPRGMHGQPGGGTGARKSREGSSGKGAAARRPGKESQARSGHAGGGPGGKTGRKRGHGGSARPGADTSGSEPGGARSERKGTGAKTKTQPGSGTGSPGRSAGRARADAAMAAAIARGKAQHDRRGHSTAAAAQTAPPAGGKPSSGAPASPTLLGGRTNIHRHKPVSEKRLALEQWLRQIPDNPAGLLRRKFLIEYMMRHRGENP